MRKKIFYLVAVILIGLIAANWNILKYGIGQGVGQLSILNGAEPIETYLNDPTFPDTLKNKIRLIQEIKVFAFDSIGLKKSNSYTKYYDQNGQPILWVVSASPPFKMEEYKWHYPILGDLGYKGYFEKEKAEKEAIILKGNGFDTDVGEVNAWSTLGYFNDPILSSMLLKSEGELARLIIHELTHTTIYISSDADFNENVATFIGDNGAEWFLESKYGKGSTELNDYKNSLLDIQHFSKHMLRGAKQLDSLYILINDKPEDERYKIKEGFIASIIDAVDTISFSNKNRFKHIKRTEFKPNNTYFMTYIMYREQQNDLEHKFNKEFNGDFKRFISYLDEKYN